LTPVWACAKRGTLGREFRRDLPANKKTVSFMAWQETMQLTWTGANILLLAQNHNPSIVSPGWLREHELVDEAPENFVHTPAFSLFQSQTYQLLVDQQRLQFSLRVLNEANLQRLQAALVRYLQILPHIPYSAIGLNFTWTALAERRGEGFDLTEHLFLSEDGRAWQKRLFGEVRVGSMLYNFTKTYRLRLLIEPQLTQDGNLTLDFNYHFDLGEPGKGTAAVNQLPECYKDSEQISRLLLKPETS